MDRLFVTGGARLAGSVRVSGAKNSALKLMAASLLAPGTQRGPQRPAHPGLRRDGRDARALRRAGHAPRTASPSWTRPHVDDVEAPDELVRQMRASIVVLGPLLARCGRARVSMPGGDEIGARPVDLHVRGLERMGATIRFEHGFLLAEADELRGAPITLDYPSVGATENLLFAAVRARGVTVIDNAAREPEIADVANCLVAMGARIEGAGSSTIEIEGVDELSPTDHTRGPRPDRGRDLGRRRRRHAGRRDDRERPRRAPRALPLQARAMRAPRSRSPTPACGSARRLARARSTS